MLLRKLNISIMPTAGWPPRRLRLMTVLSRRSISPIVGTMKSILMTATAVKTAVVADAGGQDLTTSYEYNNQSEVTKVTGPDGRFVITNRDGRGLVVHTITGIDSTEKATTSYSYDLDGNLLKKVDPMGVTEIYQYDGFGRVTRVRQGG